MIKKTFSLISLGSQDQETDKIQYFLEINKQYIDNTYKNQEECSNCGQVVIKLGNFSELSTRWEWDKANFFHQNDEEILKMIQNPKSVIVNEFGTRISKDNFIKHSKLKNEQHCS